MKEGVYAKCCNDCRLCCNVRGNVGIVMIYIAFTKAHKKIQILTRMTSLSLIYCNICFYMDIFCFYTLLARPVETGLLKSILTSSSLLTANCSGGGSFR
jgi:hypothetical protein